MTTARVLLLPGWQNSGPGHWQSLWQATHGFTRVEQDDWLWPKRGDWMARLDEVLLGDPAPALLVAHSLGCHLVAAWAAHSAHAARVAGALLVAVPDIERPDLPPQVQTWAPIVRQRLPMPATAVLSDDDPYGALERTRPMAEAWGAGLVLLPGAGHVNADSGLGDWPAGLGLLQALAQRAGVALPPAGG